jgi:hypothetical protein
MEQKTLVSNFTDINTDEIKKFLEERKTETEKLMLRSSSPQLTFIDDNLIEAGYYNFEVNGLIFEHCWIEPFAYLCMGIRYVSGSYYVRTKE